MGNNFTLLSVESLSHLCTGFLVIRMTKSNLSLHSCNSYSTQQYHVFYRKKEKSQVVNFKGKAKQMRNLKSRTKQKSWPSGFLGVLSTFCLQCKFRIFQMFHLEGKKRGPIKPATKTQLSLIFESFI